MTEHLNFCCIIVSYYNKWNTLESTSTVSMLTKKGTLGICLFSPFFPHLPQRWTKIIAETLFNGRFQSAKSLVLHSDTLTAAESTTKTALQCSVEVGRHNYSQI